MIKVDLVTQYIILGVWAISFLGSGIGLLWVIHKNNLFGWQEDDE